MARSYGLPPVSLCAQAVLCFEAEFMGKTALVDLCLKERPSYLELYFDAWKDLLAGFDLWVMYRIILIK